ncbi:uncharacterized protein LOC126549573 [Aphis gossypii]|nr:uncharacterized protein LOC126549573 [Aphis gossypii]
MNEFPALKKPVGYKLLLEDFNFLYPEKTQTLFENIPIYKDRILEHAKSISTNLRDPTLKSLLNEYLDQAQEDEESSLVAVFLVLPFLFSPVTIKKKKGKGNWRPSKSEMRDGFILHLRSHAELQESITRRKQKYEQLAFTLQPLIIIIGPTISDIAQYFILVDDTYYLVNSIITAVDCCFKIIHALHAEYPVESKPVWYFIQKGCYKLKTSWDTEYVTVNSLISDLDISI